MSFFYMSCIYFFFFKQKTAYDFRISDWSSDLCSSDLTERARLAHHRVRGKLRHLGREIGAGVLTRAPHQILALDDLDVLQRHRRRGRMARIGEAVHEIVADRPQHLDDVICHPVRPAPTTPPSQPLLHPPTTTTTTNTL